jgi:hypothetical protein
LVSSASRAHRSYGPYQRAKYEPRYCFANAGRREAPRPRIETFADLIFGVSLGIGSLVLISELPTSPAEINSHIAAFVFTFLILTTAWLVYTTDMSVLPVENTAVTFLNIGLLLLVALVPYLLNGVGLVNPSLTPSQASAIRDYSSSLFAIDLSTLPFLGFGCRDGGHGPTRILAGDIVRIPAQALRLVPPSYLLLIGRAVRPESRSYRQ